MLPAAPGESSPPVDPAESPAAVDPGSPPPVSPGESPSPVGPAAGDGADGAPLPASRPVRVRIPVLGVTSSVIGLGLEADGSMEMPVGAYPVGWYDRSPTPGEIGPSVIVGHVDWAGDRGAFYGLRALRPGDRVVVDRADGTTATFRVDGVERHDKDAFPTGEVYGDVGWPALRLITCGGRFDRKTGDYEDNVIVFARLVSTA
ncbi:class F sortase [Geodermatophilus sp. CPCC 206100]